MTVNRTTFLNLPLPVTGTESGTWGDTTNNGLTEYTDIAIAGTQVLSTDADVTLTSTDGDSSATNIGATTAQYAILRWTATGSTTRNITVPAKSKTYVVINATGGTQSIVLRGAGPTTGVTIVAGEKAYCAWNGSDFVKVGGAAGGSTTQIQFNNAGVFGGSANFIWDGTNVQIGATGALRLADTDSSNYVAFKSPGTVASNVTWTLPSADGTNGQVLTTNGSGTLAFSSVTTAPGGSTTQVQYNNAGAFAGSSNLTFDGTNLTSGGTVTATKLIPTGNVTAGNGMYLPTTNTLAFSTGGSERMRIDSLGNVGIEVTPSAWGGNWRALQVGSVGSLWGNVISSSGLFVASNYYFDGTDRRYITTNPAIEVTLGSGGTLTVLQAASGTAGNVASFTQALQLNASGGLQCLNTVSVGNTTPSTSGAGITFPATQSASSNANTLDDYEEGTWTPTFSGGFSSITYDIQNGSYVKVGCLVYCEAHLRVASISGGSGTVTLASVPFATRDSSFPNPGGFFQISTGFTTNNPTALDASGASATTYNLLYRTTANGGNNQSVPSSEVVVGSFIRATLIFQTT